MACCSILIVKVAIFILCCLIYVCKCNELTSGNYSTCRVPDLSSFGPSCSSSNYFDGNTKAVPSGRNIVCKVVYNEKDDCYRINQYTGTLEDTYRNDVAICSAIVGMNLTYVCTMEGSILYRHGVSVGSNLTSISFIRSEDAGVYECRRQGDETAVAFNVSVSGNVHIGCWTVANFVDHSFTITNGQTGQCCKTQTEWQIHSTSERSKSLYVYGEEPVLTYEGAQWKSDHYPTDLNITISKDVNNPLLWNFTISNFPLKTQTERTPRLLIIFKATNNFSSFFMCIDIEINIDFSPVPLHITSVPQNRTAVVGENVTFQCIVGTLLPSIERSLLKVALEFTLLLSDNSSQNFNVSCYWGSSCASFENNYPLNFDSVLIQNDDIGNASFTAQVQNVSEDYNGSTFVCTVLYKNLELNPPQSDYFIQWQKQAQLTVVPAPPPTTSSIYHDETTTSESNMTTEEISPHGFVKWLVAVCIVMVVIIAVAIVSIPIALFLKKKKHMHRIPQDLDQVPLTNQSTMYSSQSTICSENPGSPVPQHINLPYIEISSVNDVRRDIIVGEPRPRQPHNSMDSGVDEINSIDNISLEGGPKKPRTSLQLQLFPRFHPYTEPSPVRLCRSESDLTPCTPSTIQGSSMSNLSHRKCVVYISYTDRMADWVKSYLKPHIESWQTTEVMLHESDMIPGLTISSERQRLILEADKIVIVVSSDYSQSQWCSYELVHAIQKEPAMCRGKIIPILVDGCQSLPSIIQGLVPLPACDLDFNSRLWYAIHQTPRIHY